jgi:hypothetical protein
MGARLEVILREYMSRLERSAHSSTSSENPDANVKPMNLIIVTDGGELGPSSPETKH